MLVVPAVDSVGKDDAKFLKGDTIIQVGDRPVSDYREFAAELARQPDAAIRVIVERERKDEKGAAAGRKTRPQPVKSRNSPSRCRPSCCGNSGW